MKIYGFGAKSGVVRIFGLQSEAALKAAADKALAEMDMIVTATSGAGKKVLDITKVKPGCVITDVARPLDLPPELAVTVVLAAPAGLPEGVDLKDQVVIARRGTVVAAASPVAAPRARAAGELACRNAVLVFQRAAAAFVRPLIVDRVLARDSTDRHDEFSL